jgi:hypothetical protein
MLTVRNGRVLDGQVATERAHEGLRGGIVLVVDGMWHRQNGGGSHAGESGGGGGRTHISDDTRVSEFFAKVKELCHKTRVCKNPAEVKNETLFRLLLGFVRVDETHSFINVHVFYLPLFSVLIVSYTRASIAALVHLLQCYPRKKNTQNYLHFYEHICDAWINGSMLVGDCMHVTLNHHRRAVYDEARRRFAQSAGGRNRR